MGSTIPKVSICIPAYNNIYFLKKTLSSIIDQTFTDYELIITDDSRDDEVKKLTDTFNFGDKLSYFQNKIQLGSPKNWNFCLDRANGDYIKIMHHDDWFSCNTSLQQMVDLLESSPDYDIAFCGCNNVTISGQNLYHYCIYDEDFELLKHTPEILLERNVIGAPSVVIFKKKIKLKFDEKISYLVDIEFYINMIRVSKDLTCTTDPLINIGISELQVTNTVVNDRNKLIFEYSYTFKKLPFVSNRFNIYFDTFWRLIENVKISSKQELYDLGWYGEVPAFVNHCIYGINLIRWFGLSKVSRLIKRFILDFSFNYHFKNTLNT